MTAGFATPVDQQLRSILEIVGGALKDVSNHARQEHREEVEREKDRVTIRAEHARRRDLIARGGWHDGRIDCLCGNGIISELGLGVEPTDETDLSPPNIAMRAFTIDDKNIETKTADADLDAESELIRTLPIVVLKNFAQKSARGELWTVLSEWGANLVENRVAHVIVVAEGATAIKSLTKALPSKPLNSVGLADADEANSLGYVKEKLTEQSLQSEDSIRIAKLGGRMVDLENLVYKVRSGLTIRDAVDDIVLRNVVELRKLAFGDDAEDAKALPWTRAQAWRVVQDLAKKGEVRMWISYPLTRQCSYAQLLQEFPFKGAEQSLKALEEHELVSVAYVEGRASIVRPGKPVFRYAFEQLVNGEFGSICFEFQRRSSLTPKRSGVPSVKPDRIQHRTDRESRIGYQVVRDGTRHAKGYHYQRRRCGARCERGWILGLGEELDDKGEVEVVVGEDGKECG